jgi:hypothetical protein
MRARVCQSLIAVGTLAAACVVAHGCGDDRHRAHGTMQLDTSVVGEQATADLIDAFVATELEVLTSRKVLERVVKRLELEQSFGGTEHEALNELLRAVEARRVERSLVLEVTVYSADPEAAAKVCNQIMDAYIEQRLEARMMHVVQKVDWMAQQRDRLAEELAAVARADGGLDDERHRLKIRFDKLDAELTDAELKRRTVESDARVLDRCQWIVR